MTWTVEEFGAFIADFMATLTPADQVKITGLIKLLTEVGTELRMPKAKPLGGNLFELRTPSGVRVFYTFRPGRRIVLLGGIVKKRHDIPPTVLRLMRERAKAAP